MLEFPRQLKGRLGSERTKAQSRWRQATGRYDAPLLWNCTWTRTMLVQGGTTAWRQERRLSGFWCWWRVNS